MNPVHESIDNHLTNSFSSIEDKVRISSWLSQRDGRPFALLAKVACGTSNLPAMHRIKRLGFLLTAASVSCILLSRSKTSGLRLYAIMLVVGDGCREAA